MVIGTELAGVGEDGELMITEGVKLELSEKDKALIAKTAKTRQCRCELCEQLRVVPRTSRKS